MPADHEHVSRLIRESLAQVGLLRGWAPAPSVGEDTPLYGNGGLCDSIALVHLISNLERKLLQATGRKVALASSRAFSAKHSPFATVGSLAAFVKEQL